MAKAETSDNTVSFAAHMMKNNIPEEDLVTHIINVMFAGTDTTKTANFAALLMLGLHPNVQDKVNFLLMKLNGLAKSEPYIVFWLANLFLFLKLLVKNLMLIW